MEVKLYERLQPWPFGLQGKNGYLNYLDTVVKLIPTEQDYAREVYYQLCKFYWLVDQPSGIALQNMPEKGREKPGNQFTDWLVDFAGDWGNFLNKKIIIRPLKLRVQLEVIKGIKEIKEFLQLLFINLTSKRRRNFNS